MSKSGQVFYIPDVVANWPWPRTINPHYEEVKAEADAWLRSFQPFTSASQRAFDNCNFGLLASLAYPHATREELRIGCDLMHIFFLVDEYTDVESAPVVREMVDVMTDALRNPHKPRPIGEVLLGEVVRQFWERAIEIATPTSQAHFIESFVAYIESVVVQAADRDKDIVRDIDSYLKIRRDNAGLLPSFFPIEVALHLPDDVFYHPRVAEVTNYIAEIVMLDNDILSYNREQSTGDHRHNIITVVMRQPNTDLEGAFTWTAQYVEELKSKFLTGIKDLPSFGPAHDRELEKYFAGIAMWPRAQNTWGFEGKRYFGSRGLEYQKTRRVPLLPKAGYHAQKRGKDVVVTMIESQALIEEHMCVI